MVAATPESSTALECTGFCTRRQTRIPALASICAGRLPSKFWVTSSRCSPSARPMRVIDSSSLSCSRPPSLASSSPNSSTTTSRRGSGGSSGLLARARRYESTLLAPAEASRSWRRIDSALSSTIVRLNCSMSRFVATSITCGSGLTASWSTPPLKSTMTIDRSSGWLFNARPQNRVLRNSVLPEPDVPPTRPCGPSRTRSTIIVVPVAAPTGTAVRGPSVSQRRRTESGVSAPPPSSRSTRWITPPAMPCSSLIVGRSPATRRAAASATAVLIDATITSSRRGWCRLWNVQWSHRGGRAPGWSAWRRRPRATGARRW